jgi:hypothetical protein
VPGGLTLTGLAAWQRERAGFHDLAVARRSPAAGQIRILSGVGPFEGFPNEFLGRIRSLDQVPLRPLAAARYLVERSDPPDFEREIPATQRTTKPRFTSITNLELVIVNP